MHLNEDLLGAHGLDDLTDVRAGLLQQAELFSEQAHAGVVVVALSLEATKGGLSLEDLELHRLDLVVVVLVERHRDGTRGVVVALQTTVGSRSTRGN